MTDPGEAPANPDHVLITYLDANNVSGEINVTVDQLDCSGAGVTLYSPDPLGPIIFVPWPRILMIQNVDGGHMPNLPR